MSSFDYPNSTIQDPREVPDLDMHAHNRAPADDYNYFETSQEHPKVKQRYSSTPQGNSLPTFRPFSPFRNPFPHTPSLSDGSALSVVDRLPTPPPVECNPTDPNVIKVPQNVGWFDFRSARTSLDGADPETLYTPRPKPNKQIPSLPTQPRARPNFGQEKKHKHVQLPSVKKAFKSRKHSDMETLMKVHNLGKELQIVYHDGPKGEGQKMWSGIRGLNKEKCELKPMKISLKAPWAAGSPRTHAARTQAQNEQLDRVHAAALEIQPPRALITSPPVPVRTPLLGVVRSPVIPEPSPDSFLWEPRGREGSQGKVSTTSTYNYHSRDVPVTAAESVLYDSKESIIDYALRAKASVPKLRPAPKSRALQEKGLPPPPVRRPGEPEPPELAKQKEAYRRRVGTSPPRHGEGKLPLASQHEVDHKILTTASNPQNKHPAGSSLAVSHDFPYATSKPPPRSASLDDRPTERPPYQKTPNKAKTNKAPKKSLAETFSAFFDPHSHHKNTSSKKDPFTDLLAQTKDRARAKHQQKLKDAISDSRPVMAPGGLAVNFATEAGGVGGPGAAVAVAPQIVNPEWTALQEKREAKRRADEAGKLGFLTKSSFGFLHTVFAKDVGVKEIGEGKKGKKGGRAKHPKCSRRDSDASMVCADAKMGSNFPPVPRSESKGKQKAEDGPGAELDMRVFKGPVRQFLDQPARELRDLGPSRQMGEWPPVEDENLVPKPLGIRKGTGTGESFYPKYESLLREYRDSVDKDESVWI
ncbi:hypothetical protein PMIN05_000672 [Paraphaeosphaeria minitans]